MDIDFVFRIAAIGVIAAVVTQVLNRAGREDIAMLCALSALVIVLAMVADRIGELFESVRTLFGVYQ